MKIAIVCHNSCKHVFLPNMPTQNKGMSNEKAYMQIP